MLICTKKFRDENVLSFTGSPEIGPTQKGDREGSSQKTPLIVHDPFLGIPNTLLGKAFTLFDPCGQKYC